jgi:hypothetical protein
MTCLCLLRIFQSNGNWLVGWVRQDSKDLATFQNCANHSADLSPIRGPRPQPALTIPASKQGCETDCDVKCRKAQEEHQESGDVEAADKARVLAGRLRELHRHGRCQHRKKDRHQ